MELPTVARTQVQGELEPCCAERGNRLPVFARLEPGWRVELCGVCGRRHLYLKASEAVLHRPPPAG